MWFGKCGVWEVLPMNVAGWTFFFTKFASWTWSVGLLLKGTPEIRDCELCICLFNGASLLQILWFAEKSAIMFLRILICLRNYYYEVCFLWILLESAGNKQTSSSILNHY